MILQKEKIKDKQDEYQRMDKKKYYTCYLHNNIAPEWRLKNIH